jgi:hypothetical protein
MIAAGRGARLNRTSERVDCLPNSVSCALSLCRQPQDFVWPLLRCPTVAMITTPQSQRHSQALLGWPPHTIVSAGAITRRRPKRRRSRSSDFIFNCSTRMQPHDLVLRKVNADPTITISLPQSHRQRHVTRSFFHPARSIATSRPKRFPRRFLMGGPAIIPASYGSTTVLTSISRFSRSRRR